MLQSCINDARSVVLVADALKSVLARETDQTLDTQINKLLDDAYSYLKVDCIDLDVYLNDFNYDDADNSFTSMLNDLGFVYTPVVEGELVGWRAENVDGCFVLQPMLESLTNHFTLTYKDGVRLYLVRVLGERHNSYNDNSKKDRYKFVVWDK